MDVEAVDGVDAEPHDALCVFGAEACGQGEHSHVHILQFLYVVYYLVGCKLQGLVLVALAAHDAGDLKVGSGLQRLDGVVADVAVANYGGSDFLHVDDPF